jgi:nucleoside-diphosphate-sugar epimerase
LSRTYHEHAALSLPGGVLAIPGDITHPSLGLDAKTYMELAESITGIIHCAADTRFALLLDEARAVNTEGTRNILQFARRCPSLQKLAHISTVYVVGKAEGYFLEEPIPHPSGYCNAYQQSKYEAEELVADAMDQMPACIFRLSSIVGNSHTGAVRQFNHVHQLIRLFPKNSLPIIPGLPEARMDLIASDWALPALAFIFDHAFAPGSFYHICAGPNYSLTVREMIDVMATVFESHPRAQRWLPIRPPELVPLRQYEEFVEQHRRNGDTLLNELLRALGYFLPHLGMLQAFDNRKTLNALTKSELQLPRATSYFEKVVRYCLDTNWGRRIPCET